MTVTYTAQEREHIGRGIAEIAACFADNQAMHVKARGKDDVDIVFSGRVSSDYNAALYAVCVMQQVSMLENFNPSLFIGLAGNTPPRQGYPKKLADNFAVWVKPVEDKPEKLQLVISYKPLQNFQSNRDAMDALDARLKRGCQQARSAVAQMI